MKQLKKNGILKSKNVSLKNTQSVMVLTSDKGPICLEAYGPITRDGLKTTRTKGA